MSIEKFKGKIKEPKKLPKIKSNNPLENFDYHIKNVLFKGNLCHRF